MEKNCCRKQVIRIAEEATTKQKPIGKIVKRNCLQLQLKEAAVQQQQQKTTIQRQNDRREKKKKREREKKKPKRKDAVTRNSVHLPIDTQFK